MSLSDASRRAAWRSANRSEVIKKKVFKPMVDSFPVEEQLKDLHAQVDELQKVVLESYKPVVFCQESDEMLLMENKALKEELVKQETRIDRLLRTLAERDKEIESLNKRIR
jgi:tetrahydromethanopterin S-methyltransferase subunit B